MGEPTHCVYVYRRKSSAFLASFNKTGHQGYLHRRTHVCKCMYVCVCKIFMFACVFASMYVCVSVCASVYAVCMLRVCVEC